MSVSNVCTEVELPNGSWTVDSSDFMFSNLAEFNEHTRLCALIAFEIKIRYNVDYARWAVIIPSHSVTSQCMFVTAMLLKF